MKKVITIIFLIIFTATAYICKAQPNKEYEAMKKKNADESELQRYIDLRVPKASAKPTYSNLSPKEIRENERQKDLQDAANRKAIEDGKQSRLDAEKREEEARMAEEEATNAKEAAVKKKKSDYLRSFSAGPLMNATNMESVDYEEFQELSYFYSELEATIPDFSNAVNANLNFRKAGATASYDELVSMLYKMQRCPSAADKCLSTMYERFPEKKDSTEKLELSFFHFHFGGQLSLAYEELERYPHSQFEILRDNNTALSRDILDRFFLLAKKFPEDALIVAGKCRAFLNPYKLKGNLMYYDYSRYGQDKDERLEAYKQVLYSVSAPIDKSFGNDFILRDLERRIGGYFAFYFNNDKTGVKFMQSLSPQDWKNIANAQGTSLDNVAWALRDKKHPDDYKKNFRNLKKALGN